MKWLQPFVIFLLLLSGCSSSRDIGYTRVSNDSYSHKLALAPVNHLQLLVNNLNMFVLFLNANKKENTDNGSRIEQKYIRFHLTNTNKLALHGFYEAPVGKLTNEKCKELLKNGNASLEKADDFSKVLSIVSYYSFSKEDAKQFLRDAKFNIHIRAIENPELSVSCKG